LSDLLKIYLSLIGSDQRHEKKATVFGMYS